MPRAVRLRFLPGSGNPHASKLQWCEKVPQLSLIRCFQQHPASACPHRSYTHCPAPAQGGARRPRHWLEKLLQQPSRTRSPCRTPHDRCLAGPCAQQTDRRDLMPPPPAPCGRTPSLGLTVKTLLLKSACRPVGRQMLRTPVHHAPATVRAPTRQPIVAWVSRLLKVVAHGALRTFCNDNDGAKHS